MSKVEVGAYFYPLTTDCPERRARGEKLGYPMVDETLLAQQAVPLFEGHKQPRRFCLGESEWTRWDDNDIQAMARQVELAKTYGLDFFVFDTYIGQRGGAGKKRNGSAP